ncbi:hypothetical protein [Herbiconiux daphne]|uniref:Uncharacterized protein n=1 Tax=Herbiconiux daphne TaxID=2970914 RepID=A0ABT2H782_9MICO|nr:hypothetical protein [Herbiconiux daphne]MCS5735769.1 hypothetical protein [Herbiconiux daphne]
MIDEDYAESAASAFGDAVVAVSVYPGVHHARVDLADGTRALIDVNGNEVGRRLRAPVAQAVDAELTTAIDPATTGERPTPVRLSVFCGPRGWVARADFMGRKAWSYASSMDDIRSAAASAIAKVGAEFAPEDPIVLDMPATYLKLWPQIRGQEDYVAQLRQELRVEEQRVDELRKKSLQALRRAHVPVDDALRILADGPIIEPPANNGPATAATD